jgi:hypothetical protein
MKFNFSFKFSVTIKLNCIPKILVKYVIPQIDWDSVWDFVTERCPEFLRMLFGEGG